MSLNIYDRRTFLVAAGTGAASLFLGKPTLRAEAEAETESLDDFIEAERRRLRIPGLAACIIKDGRVVWSKGYGWANVAKQMPMDPDLVLQNIGSISKTIVATAVMQLWEKGKFQLDDDVSEYLPFAVKSPEYSNTPITYRLLLTHRSGIADSQAYGSSYASGDPRQPLEAWLKDYFTPGGRYYDQKANFHPWKPGKKSAYSNVAFGLLGYLVERASGESLPDYTRKNIFEPLGMKRTGWMLSEIDVAAHAVPYIPMGDGDSSSEEIDVYRKFGLLGGEPERDATGGAYQPLCLYSFPNYPDGALRTTVNQLARLLMAYANDGSYGSAQILKPDTVRLMLTPQAATSPQQGLCWVTDLREGRRHWGHNGADPGIRTNMSFCSADGGGVIVFVNRADIDFPTINKRLFHESTRI